LLQILWVDFLQSENHERNQSDKRSFERDLKKLTKSSLNEFQQIWYGGDIKKRFSNVVWEKVEYTFRVKFKVQSNQSVIPLTDKSSSSSTIKRRYLEKVLSIAFRHLVDLNKTKNFRVECYIFAQQVKRRVSKFKVIKITFSSSLYLVAWWNNMNNSLWFFRPILKARKTSRRKSWTGKF
jgi:hypothetical protein